MLVKDPGSRNAVRLTRRAPTLRCLGLLVSSAIALSVGACSSEPGGTARGDAQDVTAAKARTGVASCKLVIAADADSTSHVPPSLETRIDLPPSEATPRTIFSSTELGVEIVHGSAKASEIALDAAPGAIDVPVHYLALNGPGKFASQLHESEGLFAVDSNQQNFRFAAIVGTRTVRLECTTPEGDALKKDVPKEVTARIHEESKRVACRYDRLDEAGATTDSVRGIVKPLGAHYDVHGQSYYGFAFSLNGLWTELSNTLYTQAVSAEVFSLEPVHYVKHVSKLAGDPVSVPRQPSLSLVGECRRFEGEAVLPIAAEDVPRQTIKFRNTHTAVFKPAGVEGRRAKRLQIALTQPHVSALEGHEIRGELKLAGGRVLPLEVSQNNVSALTQYLAVASISDADVAGPLELKLADCDAKTKATCVPIAGADAEQKIFVSGPVVFYE
jgi:hypothetical protein